ncbi:Ig-like domain-containing protein [Hyphococcus flavus]|uniref:Ig-like domain-containing protein n=1 Tax=Hyphococcus flavus TaxID=1866326 RepID=A0AAF0CHN0_9PROT|nr:Ig-like domain-containing protein [Hyphococcus flavus]WDI32097.1 Ig-like domain-containing protein [Hyphococcus flavus]
MRSGSDVSTSYSSLDLRDILHASEAGLLKTPEKPGKRSRRRSVKKTMTQASMIAPLLAAEGCLTIGGGEGPLASAPGNGGPANGGDEPAQGGVTPPPAAVTAVQAEDDPNFTASTSEMVHIAVDDLLANDARAPGTTIELVRVFGAQHGTVMLHDGVIHFTPHDGHEGLATFQYEVRDSNGNRSRAEVEIHVGDHQQQGGGHEDSGHGGGHGGHGGHAHPDDPAKATEHMAVLNLVPVSDATHVAVKNGSWFDPSTWAGGEVPAEGAQVLIPEGIEVAYDGQSAVSLFTVRVDGSLDFATDANTFMEVDTLVVAPGGKMTIGTVDNPVAADVETIIQIADNGPIDTSWDPMLFSRGVISHGDVQIHGAEKTSFLKVASDPMAGDTSLSLESPPDGWKVGDKLVLTGTHLTEADTGDWGEPHPDTSQDEELVITRIDGNVIHFDRPLQYDHEGPRADLKAYVANYSRNVQILTENADGVPVHQRGHVMFMHSDDIDVRYAEFFELGRTDKSERAFDVADLNSVDADSNIKARYSLHLHRAGVSELDDPAMIVGNAVWGSPGWGYVHHDSNAIMTDNAAYDVFGAAFVAETGNETGRWSHNISIKSIGVRNSAKQQEDVLAFDLGRTGAGFWFQGRLVDAIDNVAAGVPGGHGFVYMSRGNDVIPVDPATADWSESLRYVDEAFINYPAISQFQNNEAFAVGIGLEVVKAGAEQAHDVRSVIEGFTGWEVRTGIHLQYTAHYTLKGIDLLATDQSAGADTPWRGIEYGPNSIDNVINGASIVGFPTGVHLAKTETNLNFPFDGNWGYVFIDVDVQGATTNFANLDARDTFMTEGDLTAGRLLFDSDIDNIPVAPTPESRGYLDLTGWKTDSIGDARVSPTWDPIRFDYFTIQGAIMEEGYWTLPDGRKVTVIDQYFADRATGVVDKVSVFVEWERNFSDFPEPPRYNGVLDLDSQAPVARADFATVEEGGYVDIDVLANDYDPDGDEINIDGICPPDNGAVFVNDDGTLRYLADPNFTGEDKFMYWVEDEHGNFTKNVVTVTVDI